MTHSIPQILEESTYTLRLDTVRFEVAAFFRMDSYPELAIAMFEDNDGVGTVDLKVQDLPTGEVGYVVECAEDPKNILENPHIKMFMLAWCDINWLLPRRSSTLNGVILKNRRVSITQDTTNRKWQL